MTEWELPSAYEGDLKPEREGFLAVHDQGRVWYRVNGVAESGTPILVVHGGPGMSHHYLLSLTDLAADRPVYFYDQVECGMSDRPGLPENWTVDFYVEELEKVRRALGLDEFFVLGQSWGGTIAPQYASGGPAGLKGLILASPCVSVPRWVADAPGLRAMLPAEVRDVLDSHEAEGTIDDPEYLSATETYSAHYFCNLDPLPEDVARMYDFLNEEQFVQMWGGFDFSATGTIKDYDGTPHLADIDVPTLVTVGEFDECTPAAARDFADAIPRSELVEFSGAAHCAHLESRSEYMATLRRWMTEIETV